MSREPSARPPLVSSKAFQRASARGASTAWCSRCGSPACRAPLPDGRPLDRNSSPQVAKSCAHGCCHAKTSVTPGNAVDRCPVPDVAACLKHLHPAGCDVQAISMPLEMPHPETRGHGTSASGESFNTHLVHGIREQQVGCEQPPEEQHRRQLIASCPETPAPTIFQGDNRVVPASQPPTCTAVLSLDPAELRETR